MVGLCLPRAILVYSNHPKVYDDETVEVYLEIFQDQPFIHVISKEWSKEAVTHYTDVFVELCDQLAERGYTKLFAAILPEDKKLQKFSSMFGFEETENTLLDNQGRTRIIYKCGI